jgi:hypothetical protein
MQESNRETPDNLKSGPDCRGDSWSRDNKKGRPQAAFDDVVEAGAQA